MLTTWLPLMDIPPVLGGLAIRPGGHLGPLRRPHLLSPAGPADRPAAGAVTVLRRSPRLAAVAAPARGGALTPRAD